MSTNEQSPPATEQLSRLEIASARAGFVLDIVQRAVADGIISGVFGAAEGTKDVIQTRLRRTKGIRAAEDFANSPAGPNTPD